MGGEVGYCFASLPRTSSPWVARSAFRVDRNASRIGVIFWRWSILRDWGRGALEAESAQSSCEGGWRGLVNGSEHSLLVANAAGGGKRGQPGGHSSADLAHGTPSIVSLGWCLRLRDRHTSWGARRCSVMCILFLSLAGSVVRGPVQVTEADAFLRRLPNARRFVNCQAKWCPLCTSAFSTTRWRVRCPSCGITYCPACSCSPLASTQRTRPCYPCRKCLKQRGVVSIARAWSDYGLLEVFCM